MYLKWVNSGNPDLACEKVDLIVFYALVCVCLFVPVVTRWERANLLALVCGI